MDEEFNIYFNGIPTGFDKIREELADIKKPIDVLLNLRDIDPGKTPFLDKLLGNKEIQFEPSLNLSIFDKQKQELERSLANLKKDSMQVTSEVSRQLDVTRSKIGQLSDAQLKLRNEARREGRLNSSSYKAERDQIGSSREALKGVASQLENTLKTFTGNLDRNLTSIKREGESQLKGGQRTKELSEFTEFIREFKKSVAKSLDKNTPSRNGEAFYQQLLANFDRSNDPYSFARGQFGSSNTGRSYGHLSFGGGDPDTYSTLAQIAQQSRDQARLLQSILKPPSKSYGHLTFPGEDSGNFQSLAQIKKEVDAQNEAQKTRLADFYRASQTSGRSYGHLSFSGDSDPSSFSSLAEVRKSFETGEKRKEQQRLKEFSDFQKSTANSIRAVVIPELDLLSAIKLGDISRVKKTSKTISNRPEAVTSSIEGADLTKESKNYYGHFNINEESDSNSFTTLKQAKENALKEQEKAAAEKRKAESSFYAKAFKDEQALEKKSQDEREARIKERQQIEKNAFNEERKKEQQRAKELKDFKQSASSGVSGLTSPFKLLDAVKSGDFASIKSLTKGIPLTQSTSNGDPFLRTEGLSPLLAGRGIDLLAKLGPDAVRQAFAEQAQAPGEFSSPIEQLSSLQGRLGDLRNEKGTLFGGVSSKLASSKLVKKLFGDLPPQVLNVAKSDVVARAARDAEAKEIESTIGVVAQALRGEGKGTDNEEFFLGKNLSGSFGTGLNTSKARLGAGTNSLRVFFDGLGNTIASKVLGAPNPNYLPQRALTRDSHNSRRLSEGQEALSVPLSELNTDLPLVDLSRSSVTGTPVNLQNASNLPSTAQDNQQTRTARARQLLNQRKANRFALFAEPEEFGGHEGVREAAFAQFGEHPTIRPQTLDYRRLVDRSTLLQSLFSFQQGLLPGIGSLAGGATTAGPEGALIGSVIGSALELPVNLLKEAAGKLLEAGITFNKSVLGIASIQQENTQLVSGSGAPIPIGQQIDIQQRKAVQIQLAARSRLLPLGIAGQSEATFVQGITSALSQRGIDASPEQISKIAELLGGTIRAQRPGLLDNPTLLLRDIQDVVGGGPQSSRVLLSQLIGRTATTGIKKATSADDYIKALSAGGLQGQVDAVKNATNIQTSLQKISGAFDQLVTKGGAKFIDEFAESLSKFANVIAEDAEKGGKLTQFVEEFSSGLGAIVDSTLDFGNKLLAGGESIFKTLDKINFSTPEKLLEATGNAFGFNGKLTKEEDSNHFDYLYKTASTDPGELLGAVTKVIASDLNKIQKSGSQLLGVNQDFGLNSQVVVDNSPLGKARAEIARRTVKRQVDELQKEKDEENIKSTRRPDAFFGQLFNSLGLNAESTSFQEKEDKTPRELLRKLTGANGDKSPEEEIQNFIKEHPEVSSADPRIKFFYSQLYAAKKGRRDELAAPYLSGTEGGVISARNDLTDVQESKELAKINLQNINSALANLHTQTQTDIYGLGGSPDKPVAGSRLEGIRAALTKAQERVQGTQSKIDALKPSNKPGYTAAEDDSNILKLRKLLQEGLEKDKKAEKEAQEAYNSYLGKAAGALKDEAEAREKLIEKRNHAQEELDKLEFPLYRKQQALLASKAVREQGFFSGDTVQSKLSQAESGANNEGVALAQSEFFVRNFLNKHQGKDFDFLSGESDAKGLTDSQLDAFRRLNGASEDARTHLFNVQKANRQIYEGRVAQREDAISGLDDDTTGGVLKARNNLENISDRRTNLSKDIEKIEETVSALYSNRQLNKEDTKARDALIQEITDKRSLVNRTDFEQYRGQLGLVQAQGADRLANIGTGTEADTTARLQEQSRIALEQRVLVNQRLISKSTQPGAPGFIGPLTTQQQKDLPRLANEFTGTLKDNRNAQFSQSDADKQLSARHDAEQSAIAATTAAYKNLQDALFNEFSLRKNLNSQLEDSARALQEFKDSAKLRELGRLSNAIGIGEQARGLGASPGIANTGGFAKSSDILYASGGNPGTQGNLLAASSTIGNLPSEALSALQNPALAADLKRQQLEEQAAQAGRDALSAPVTEQQQQAKLQEAVDQNRTSLDKLTEATDSLRKTYESAKKTSDSFSAIPDSSPTAFNFSGPFRDFKGFGKPTPTSPSPFKLPLAYLPTDPKEAEVSGTVSGVTGSPETAFSATARRTRELNEKIDKDISELPFDKSGSSVSDAAAQVQSGIFGEKPTKLYGHIEAKDVKETTPAKLGDVSSLFGGDKPFIGGNKDFINSSGDLDKSEANAFGENKEADDKKPADLNQVVNVLNRIATLIEKGNSDLGDTFFQAMEREFS